MAAAASGTFSIRISAVDNASKTFAALNRQIAAMQAPFKALSRNLSKFSDLTGITRLRTGLASLGRTALRVVQSIGGIIAPLGAITGAASLAGMYKLVSSWGEFGTALMNTAARLGMTTSNLQSMQNAARLAGASAGSFTSGMKSLGDSMQDAVAGRAPEFLQLMQMLHVNIRKNAYEAKSAAEVLPELADKIAAIKNPTIQAQLATRLFGGAAEELLPFLKRGSAGMKEFQDLAAHYGVTTADGAQKADDFRVAQTRLQLAVEGFTNSVAEQAGPAVSDLLVQLSEWIAANKEWIAQDIGYYVKQFATWLKSINWHDVGEGIKQWWHRIKEVVDALGGWKALTVEIFALWAIGKTVGVLAGIAQIVSAISGITSAANLAKAAMGGIEIAEGGGLLAMLGGGASSLAGAALSPVGLAIGAAIAAGFVGYFAYHHSDWFKGVVDNLFTTKPDRNTAHPMPTFGTPTASSEETWSRMIAQESGGHQLDKDGKPLTSSAGAVGIAQVMPATAFEVARRHAIAWDNDKYLHDADYNRTIGHLYYQEMLDKYHNTMLAAMAYDAGPGRVDQWLSVIGDPRKGQISEREFINRVPNAEARDYAARVAPPGSMLGRSTPSPNLNATPTPTPTPEGGQVHVSVDIKGAPPGTTAHATARGNTVAHPPRVSPVMPAGAHP